MVLSNACLGAELYMDMDMDMDMNMDMDMGQYKGPF
jgi:hypothetical protein